MTYVEWIPVNERLPAVAGEYDTLVTLLLDGVPMRCAQRYTPPLHPAFSGWQEAPVTHWRVLTE